MTSADRRSLTRRWLATILLGCLGLLCLVACSRLPVLVPDLARRAGSPVQLEGSRGALSPAQSQAILQRLSRLGPDTGIFDRHLAREEAIVDSPLTTGNRVLLLQDGPAALLKDLTSVIALLGLPCGRVVSAKALKDDDHIASCQDGNRYRVFINAEGRVVAQRLKA